MWEPHGCYIYGWSLVRGCHLILSCLCLLSNNFDNSNRLVVERLLLWVPCWTLCCLVLSKYKFEMLNPFSLLGRLSACPGRVTVVIGVLVMYNFTICPFLGSSCSLAICNVFHWQHFHCSNFLLFCFCFVFYFIIIILFWKITETLLKIYEKQ